MSDAMNKVIVDINSGKVEGIRLKTWKNKDFIGFRGIPYARAPIGELRFKDPLPHLGWNGIFDATKDGPIAPQPRKRSEEMSEDCLRINVYTKDVSALPKKPVLVYIHCGGLYVGSGNSDDFGGPIYLMEHNIVLVTFNYRLGFLGFFNLGTKEYPGNAGFKDQVLALRWIQENILFFGGDPNHVTLIGNSAGAMCAVLHLVSPMSRNLFHQAIIASGGINFQTPANSNQRWLIQKQAKILNLEYGTDEELVQAFKAITVDKFIETLYDCFEFGHDNPIFLWSYVIEQDFGQERFLTEDPRVSLANDRFMKVPVMAGVTENELMTSAVEILKNPNLLKEFYENFENWAPICFGYERNTSFSVNTSQALRVAYNIQQSPEVKPDQIGQLFSDAMIGFANYRVVQILRRNVPVYHYLFSYTGRYSFLCYPENEPYGAEHCDDFTYLFVNSRYMPVFRPTDPEAKIIDFWTYSVANFASTGNPNLKGEIKWKMSTNESNYYLEIGSQIELKHDLFKKRYGIWDQLFPLDNFIQKKNYTT